METFAEMLEWLRNHFNSIIEWLRDFFKINEAE